ncbi:MAG: MATE family efflux transporter [bacterium]|nr:MATE family efflux transporter [bacterium]
MAHGTKSSAMMTEGVIWKQLILFSIPLLIGNLFQQLYNTVDSIVVGNFIGSEALAAVGSSNSLINLIIGMFIGIATGAGVVISQYYGARDNENMEKAVHTSIMLSIIGGGFLILLGIGASPVILRWMKTPAEVLPNSVLYLRVYFGGSLFNLVYNMCAGILRAVGDSKRPLYYLCISSMVNIVLDLLFVVAFHMGIAGVGYATVIAQAVSAVLALGALSRSYDSYHLDFRRLRIDVSLMKQILAMGIPSGVQGSIISLSNVIVQSNINSYGAVAMAGYGAYTKVDGFAMLPQQTFCMAATTFTGQNVGAKKPDRVKKSIFWGLFICGTYTIVMSAFLYLYSGNILRIFSSDTEVIRYGQLVMGMMLPFYLLLTVHQILMGTMRGAGKSMVTMMISVGNMCVLRMIYINLLVPFFPSFEAVMWCYPITWFSTALMDVLYIWKANWLPKEQAEEETELKAEPQE